MPSTPSTPSTPSAPSALTDSFGRVHDYIRISVTDRCNLRCQYCMPMHGMKFMPDEWLLTYDEIAAIVRVLAAAGIRKVRLTGGEPLVRKGLADLIAAIAAIPGIDDIALTTNGVLLAAQAEALKRAGLNRVNISLDSLNADTFAAITRGGEWQRVWDGVEAALAADLHPVKLNVVLLRGYNSDDIGPLLELTRHQPLHVRFIEYMPIGHDDDAWRDRYFPLTGVLDTCRQRGWAYAEADATPGNGPARYYRLAGAQGIFGLIHPVSDHFCAACNRLRLTADGYLKPCLYWNDEFYLRPYVHDEHQLRAIVTQALTTKPLNHEMARVLSGQDLSYVPTTRRMSQIGG